MKQILFYILLLFPLLTYSETQLEPYSTQPFDKEIKTIFKKGISSPTKNIQQNMLDVATYFLGRPFLLFALGEGPDGTFDQAPLYRTDAFDCETFVLTVLALSQSDSLESFKKRIVELNYANGEPNFIQRNHFTATQWLPNNIRKGFVQDITKIIYPKALTISITVNFSDWLQHITSDRIQVLKPISTETANTLLTKLHHSSQGEVNTASISFIPKEAFLAEKTGQKLLQKIPDGTIVLFLRDMPTPSQNTLGKYFLGHFAIAFWQNKMLCFFECSLNKRKTVVISAKEYLGSWDGIRGITLVSPKTL